MSNNELTTTTDWELRELAGGLPNFNIYSSDKLPKKVNKKPMCGIVNMDDSSGPGTHWTAFWVPANDKYTVYYDSFGMDIDPRLLSFLKTSGNQVIGLSNQQQDIQSKACGYYCIHFLREMNKGTSIGKFMSQFGSNEKENEKILEQYIKKGEGVFEDVINWGVKVNNSITGRKDKPLKNIPNPSVMGLTQNLATQITNNIPIKGKGSSGGTISQDYINQMLAMMLNTVTIARPQDGVNTNHPDRPQFMLDLAILMDDPNPVSIPDFRLLQRRYRAICSVDTRSGGALNDAERLYVRNCLRYITKFKHLVPNQLGFIDDMINNMNSLLTNPNATGIGFLRNEIQGVSEIVMDRIGANATTAQLQDPVYMMGFYGELVNVSQPSDPDGSGVKYGYGLNKIDAYEKEYDAHSYHRPYSSLGY